MSKNISLALIASAVLLGGCEARFGNDAGPVAENATAEGRAEEGRLTVEAPGFNLSVKIPEAMLSEAQFGDKERLIYPGARFGGIHVQGKESQGSDGDGEVELRFTTPDPVDRVVAWYRDPARRQSFEIGEAGGENGAFRFEGRQRPEGDRFVLRLAPGADGGTEARMLLSDRTG